MIMYLLCQPFLNKIRLEVAHEKCLVVIFLIFVLLALFHINLLLISSSVYLYLGEVYCIEFRIQVGENFLKKRALVTGSIFQRTCELHMRI